MLSLKDAFYISDILKVEDFIRHSFFSNVQIGKHENDFMSIYITQKKAYLISNVPVFIHAQKYSLNYAAPSLIYYLLTLFNHWNYFEFKNILKGKLVWNYSLSMNLHITHQGFPFDCVWYWVLPQTHAHKVTVRPRILSVCWEEPAMWLLRITYKI